MPSSRRILLIALPLLAITAYVGFWFYEAALVRDGLAAWTAERRAEGFTVGYDAPRIAGFPFRVAVRLDHPSIAAPDAVWRWSGEAAEGEVHPWAFRHVTVHPIGRQEVAFPGEGGTALLVLEAAEAGAVIDVDARGRLEQGNFEAKTLTLSAPGAAVLSVGKVHLELSGPAEPSGPAKGPSLPVSAALSLRLDDVTLPAAGAGPLGAKLGWLAAEAQLRGPLDAASPMAALRAWRDAGGTLELKSFSLAWGPLQLAGNATLALDPNLQPEGAGTGEIRGFAETIDALAGQGLMQRDNAGLAKAALGLMARTPPGGGAKVLSVPLTLQRQTLYAGPFGLLRLPTIKWAG